MSETTRNIRSSLRKQQEWAELSSRYDGFRRILENVIRDCQACGGTPTSEFIKARFRARVRSMFPLVQDDRLNYWLRQVG